MKRLFSFILSLLLTATALAQPQAGTTYMTGPAAGTNTTVVNGSTYSVSVGNVISVPNSDVQALLNSGWVRVDDYPVIQKAAGLIINASDINPSNTAATNATNMATRITACVAAGGCVIQLGCYTAPIPIANSSGPGIVLGTEQAAGSQAADVPFSGVTIRGCAYALNQNTNVAQSGTVLQGTSTNFPLIAYNYVDNTTDYLNASNFGSSYLNVNIQDLGLDTASYCIKFGALSKAGLYQSQIRNVTCSHYLQYAFWIENTQESTFDSLYANTSSVGAVGTMAFVNSGGSLIFTGNNHMRHLFGEPSGTANMRGILFLARNSALGVAGQFNDEDVYDIQQNGPGTTVTSAVTFAGGTANINVTNMCNFPVDMPVTMTTNVGGLTKYQTYFVVSNNGVTTSGSCGGSGSGNIQIASREGANANAITETSGSGTIESFGYPGIEIVGYGQNTNSVTTGHWDGIDDEANGTTTLLVQNAQGSDLQISNIPGGSTAQGNSQANSITLRNSVVTMRTRQGVVVDSDNASVLQSSFDATYANSSVTWPNNYGLPGFCVDLNKSIVGLNLGGLLYPNNNPFACDIQQSTTGAAHWWQANVAIGQKSIFHSFGSSPGASDAASAGVDIFKATAGGVAFALTTPSTTNPDYSAAGQTANSTTGLPFTMFNDGANAFTSTSTAFDNLSGLGTINIPPNGLVSVRSEADGTTGFYQIESIGPNVTITTTSAGAISGCGTAGSVGQSENAAGFSGTFSCGTGASPATVTVTMPKAAPHYWICNADDITTGPTHLPNSGTPSTTQCIFKGNITTSDVVIYQATPY